MKMQHLVFKRLLIHWERQIRKQMKTVSCRDEGLDAGKEGIFESCIKVASAVAAAQLIVCHSCCGELRLDLAQNHAARAQ